MKKSISQVHCEFHAGGMRPNEDRLLHGDQLFGVFDGASSLVPDLYSGHTGAWWASHLACTTFGQDDASLCVLGERANDHLKQAMNKEGVAAHDSLSCWSTSAAVVRVEEDRIEWAHIGDCQVLAVEASGRYRLLTPYRNHDRQTLAYLKELIAQDAANPHEQLRPRIEEVRRGMNRDYGVLNGDERALDFLNCGTTLTEDIDHLLLFTDGLLPPTENPEEERDLQWIVDLYLQGGLAMVRASVRRLEEQDPQCRRYPRFKPHDDIAAIALTLQ